jgi:hypothetical protein
MPHRLICMLANNNRTPTGAEATQAIVVRQLKRLND